MSEDANKAYQSAVNQLRVPRSAPLGTLRLAHRRTPFQRPLEDLTELEKAQLREVFGDDFDFVAFFAHPPQSGKEGWTITQSELVDLVDTETGITKYELVLLLYGHGVIFHAGTTTRASSITQHGVNPSEDCGKAWLADFARAWAEGAARLGLWEGHVLFSAEEMGEPDDDD